MLLNKIRLVVFMTLFLVPPMLPKASAQTPLPAADSPAGFLSLLNAERARNGRPPLAWDANLAAYASRNTAIHAPGSSGGGSQCWASGTSYARAFAMWMASAPHRTILMGARAVVGVARCPSGVTANAR